MLTKEKRIKQARQKMEFFRGSVIVREMFRMGIIPDLETPCRNYQQCLRELLRELELC